MQADLSPAQDLDQACSTKKARSMSQELSLLIVFTILLVPANLPPPCRVCSTVSLNRKKTNNLFNSTMELRMNRRGNWAEKKAVAESHPNFLSA